MSIPKISVNNSVLSNMLMFVVIVFGTYSWFTLPRDLTPEIITYTARIMTSYPGAGPEEVEKLVTVPIEDAIEGIKEIDLIVSDSSEGRSSISVQFNEMSEREFDKRLQDLRNAVDRVNNLPSEIFDKPEVLEINMSSGFPAITIAVGGEISETTMIDIAERLKEKIEEVDGVAEVRTAGIRDRQIWVELDPNRLRAYGIPLIQVANALRTKNLTLPAGTLDVGRSEYLVRTIGEFQNISELENTTINIGKTATPLKLSELATISDTYEKPLSLSRVNGNSSISLTVQKTREGDVLKLVKEVRALVREFSTNTPDGTDLQLINDYSVILKERLGILQNNAFFGIILVIILLWVFMGLRNALFAALGIPVAFMATFFFLEQIGETINSPSLFGLILVIGIVVDDAVVVIENVFRRIQEGMSPREAAIVGAEEVATPVLAASLTTIAAFSPLMMMSGIMGQFMRVVPIAAIAVIVASLVEVFMILPSHMAEWSKVQNPAELRHRLFDAVRQGYIKLLAKTIRWRYPVFVVVMFGGLAVSILAFKMLDKEVFPGDDFPQFYIKAEMPHSFGLKESSRVVSQLEKIVSSLGSEEMVAIVSNIGINTPTSLIEGNSFRPNIAEILVELVPKDQRSRSRDEIISDLWEKLSTVSDAKMYVDKMEGGPPTGKDIDVKVKGERFEVLREISDRLKIALGEIDGVTEIRDDFQLGKSELQIRLKDEKATQYGLNVFQIAHTVRNALEGNIATTYRTADKSIDVVVKYDVASGGGLSVLEELLITTPLGVVVPLKDVATISEGQGYGQIKRFENERTIAVFAAVDRKKITPVEVTEKLISAFSEIESIYPGYTLDFRGEFDSFNESLEELKRLFLVGFMLMYLILGTQFKSFLQPVIILFAVPFGVIGAMIGLLVVNATLSIIAMFGVVALMGIVVNDSIVLIDFINRLRAEGNDVWRAVMKGAGMRLRPIVLTSVTTIFGLIPMAIGLGGKSPVWMPLASTIIFGLLFSTILTLFVMPALYAIVADLQRSK